MSVHGSGDPSSASLLSSRPRGNDSAAATLPHRGDDQESGEDEREEGESDHGGRRAAAAARLAPASRSDRPAGRHRRQHRVVVDLEPVGSVDHPPAAAVLRGC